MLLALGWHDLSIENTQDSDAFYKCVMLLPTDRPTDQPTDTAYHRYATHARAHLKKKRKTSCVRYAEGITTWFVRENCLRCEAYGRRRRKRVSNETTEQKRLLTK